MFYPLPKPTDQVSATTLDEISAYLDADFKPIIDVWAKDARAFIESAKLGRWPIGGRPRSKFFQRDAT